MADGPYRTLRVAKEKRAARSEAERCAKRKWNQKQEEPRRDTRRGSLQAIEAASDGSPSAALEQPHLDTTTTQGTTSFHLSHPTAKAIQHFHA